jgi:hypothetical protein
VGDFARQPQWTTRRSRRTARTTAPRAAASRQKEHSWDRSASAPPSSSQPRIADAADRRVAGGDRELILGGAARARLSCAFASMQRSLTGCVRATSPSAVANTEWPDGRLLRGSRAPHTAQQPPAHRRPPITRSAGRDGLWPNRRRPPRVPGPLHAPAPEDQPRAPRDAPAEPLRTGRRRPSRQAVDQRQLPDSPVAPRPDCRQLSIASRRSETRALRPETGQAATAHLRARAAATREVLPLRLAVSAEPSSLAR